MNKRGQFYLIAAIVIVTIAVGFIIISNSVSSQQTPNIYYQRDEIKIEGLDIINYSVTNQLGNTQLSNDLTDLSERYINNSQNENFYFIFGNATKIVFLAYQALYSNVSLNGVDYTNTVGTGNIYSQSFVPSSNVILGVNGNQYNYPVNSGESFNFVLYSNLGGQSYTAEG
jgi:hypothetical protein